MRFPHSNVVVVLKDMLVATFISMGRVHLMALQVTHLNLFKSQNQHHRNTVQCIIVLLALLDHTHTTCIPLRNVTLSQHTSIMDIVGVNLRGSLMHTIITLISRVLPDQLPWLHTHLLCY